MKNIKPTDSELEILQLLWQHGPLSVRTINEMLNELSGNNSIGYSTTLKIMQIMYEKGILKRNTDQRSHIYEAALKENETQQNLLSEFLDATYRGSASTLVMQALGNHKASDAELQMIKNFIKDLETNTRNTSKNKK